MDKDYFTGQYALNEVLKNNPGLSKVFNLDNTRVMVAPPQRVRPGSLEFWSPDEPGTPDLPHPTGDGKTVLEIYDRNLMNDPEALKNAIYGDLLHGMHKDAHYNKLRTEFIKSYTPEEKGRIANKQSWWEDANGANANEMAIHDAYIRGWLNDSGIEGQKASGGTMYSPQQLEVLDRMKRYISTGQEE
jgi:hypothetical protein